jgi:hypothetical protein
LGSDTKIAGLHFYFLTFKSFTMAETSYQDIKTMSANFKQMLTTHKTTLPFDVDNSALVVLVDVATDLNAILSTNPEKLAVILGLENNRITVCLLGHNTSSALRMGAESDSDLRLDPDPPPGQETWPDEEIITQDEDDEYNQFFP